ncbi:plasmid stabilization protein [Streptomyces achromogenes]|uniref:plasmid stabilization protein n=1 Tax=Streptomyces achromogenes TaxID=67255 RepID=UPI00340FA515
MPAGSSSKRERQYEHIKDSAEGRGASERRAKEMAARTVNKERARSGETKSASSGSTKGKSPSQRGGERSGSARSGGSGPTREQLYEEARKQGIEGRSTMNKDQLARALGH